MIRACVLADKLKAAGIPVQGSTERTSSEDAGVTISDGVSVQITGARFGVVEDDEGGFTFHDETKSFDVLVSQLTKILAKG